MSASRTAFGDIIFPRARKTYRCEWCGEWIEIGEKHGKFVGVHDGDFQSYRIHLECEDYMDQLRVFTEDLDEGFLPHEHGRGLTKEAQIARRLAGIENYWIPDEDQKNFG